MAIDKKFLTEIINVFRVQQSKEAISPESLGNILQRITGLLAAAGTPETGSNNPEIIQDMDGARQRGLGGGKIGFRTIYFYFCSRNGECNDHDNGFYHQTGAGM